MWQITGKINKALGKQVYRAELLKPSGEGKYTWIRSLYFAEGEKFLVNKQLGAVELHLENVYEYKRNVAICRVNSETGQPIKLGNGATVTYPPTVLHRLLKTEHLEGAGKASLGGNTNLMMCLLCLGLGLAGGFILAQYLPAITGAFTDGGNRTQAIARPIVEALRYAFP